MCDEIVEVYNAHRPRALKEHRCTECNGKIRRGEVYEKRSFVFDGRGETHKVCRFCVALAEHYLARIGEYCIPLGDLVNYVNEGEDNDWLPEGVDSHDLTNREYVLSYLQHHKVAAPDLEHETEGMQRQRRLQGATA